MSWVRDKNGNKIWTPIKTDTSTHALMSEMGDILFWDKGILKGYFRSTFLSNLFGCQDLIHDLPFWFYGERPGSLEDFLVNGYELLGEVYN